MGKWQRPEPSTDAVDGLSKVLSQLQMLQGILLKKAEEDRRKLLIYMSDVFSIVREAALEVVKK